MELIDRGGVPALDVVRADATRAFRYMKSGGVAVLPLDVSYAIFAATARGVERIFELKNRMPTKPNGVVGNWDIFADVLKTGPRDKDRAGAHVVGVRHPADGLVGERLSGGQQVPAR